MYGRSILLTTITVSAIGTLFMFGVKNLLLSAFNPGSLTIMEGEIVSVKLDPDVVALLSTRHSHERL